jgi:RsmE family RNA methyltransferase
MRLTRVHVDDKLQSGQQLTVEGSAGNHIARVLRLRAGDAITLFNGQGGEYAGSIQDIRRDSVLISVLEHRAVERESTLELVLAQGISRGERMDWVVQKATELGVSRIVPVFTERSVVHLDERQASRKLQHWRSIAIAACEQSGRNRIPDIDTPIGVHDWLQQGVHDWLQQSPPAGAHSAPASSPSPPSVTPSAPTNSPTLPTGTRSPPNATRSAPADAQSPPLAAPPSPGAAQPVPTRVALLLSPNADARLTDIAPATAATVLIGPEGGLTDIEQESAIKVGFTPVRLGPRILRTETAAVCALTLLQQRFGDL